MRRDWEHENESKNFGIFKEISGYLGSLLGICTKLQLATLFLTLETKWRLGKQAFRSVKLVMCLLPRFNHNQLGEDIIKSEEPDFCCTKRCDINTT